MPNLFVVLVLFLVLNVNKGVMVLRENEAEHVEAVAALEQERSELQSEKQMHAAATARMVLQMTDIRRQQIAIANIMGVNRYTGKNAATHFNIMLRENGGEYDILPIPAGKMALWYMARYPGMPGS